jgi:hypothetical protein
LLSQTFHNNFYLPIVRTYELSQPIKSVIKSNYVVYNEEF